MARVALWSNDPQFEPLRIDEDRQIINRIVNQYLGTLCEGESIVPSVGEGIEINNQHNSLDGLRII